MPDLFATYTLPAGNTNYRLSDLITAALGVGQTTSFNYLSVESDDANVSPILVGGSDLSDTNYAKKIASPEEAYSENSNSDDIHTTRIYVRARGATANQKIHVRGRVH
jgi:hypothetical protein